MDKYEKYSKQPNESITYQMNFAPGMCPGRVLVGCTPIQQSVYRSNLANPAPLAIGDHVIFPPGFVQFTITGGSHWTHYKVSALATDSGGDKIQVNGLLEVRER